MERIWNKGDIFPGGYKILNIIDSGGMGTVYIIQSISSNRILAAKTYKSILFNQPSFVHRFEYEAEIWVKVGAHPHIVYADFVNSIEGIPYIFLEYIIGGNLRDLIYKKFSLSKALSIAIQSCEGMDYLHNRCLNETNKGVMHCDLKPENILVSEDGIIKISDFGLVKAFEDFSTPGMIAGTPEYMSPEQFHGINHMTKSSDVYSFGVILYEMLTGNLPFLSSKSTHKERIKDLRRQHYNDIPIPPASLMHDIPNSLSKLILTCIEKKMDRRIQNFYELKKKLCEINLNVTGQAYQLIIDNMEKEAEHIRLARSYQNLQKPNEAVIECDKALDFKLTSDQLIDVLNIKSVTLGELERYQESLECIDNALKIDPDNSMTWANRGLAFQGMKKYNEAISCYDRSIQLYQYDWGPYHNKGVALDLLGFPEESLQWFEKALSINPRHVNSLSSMGNVLQKLGRYNEAIEFENKALKINPRNPSAINNLVVIYMKMKAYDEALKWSDSLIQLDLRCPHYWYNKSSVLLKMNRFDSAIQTINDGFDKTDDKVKLLELNLMILLEIVKIRAEPKYHLLIHECIIKILDLDPNHNFARAAMEEIEIIKSSNITDDAKELDRKGEYLLNIGMIDDSIPLFLRAMELDPTFMSPHCNMGLAMELRGEKETAISYYNRAIELDSSHYMPLYNKGNCFKDKGDFHGAIDLYIKSSELNPDFLNVWIAISYCYYQLNDKQNALKAANRALEIESQNPMVLQNLRVIACMQ